MAGRLAVLEDHRPVPLWHVQAVLGAPVSVELRRGRRVIAVELDLEGHFVARAPAGRYRLEYLVLGRQAEFFEPQVLEVRPGALLCAGTLSLDVPRLELLGDGSASRLTAANDCARMLPSLRALARWGGPAGIRLAVRAPPEEEPRELTLPDLLLGFRAEASVNGSELALRGWYVYPLLGTLGEPAAVTLHLGGARLSGSPPGFGVELSAGAGINLFGPLELAGAIGVRAGVEGFPTEPLLAVILRAGFPGAGLDFRAQWTLVGPALFVGVDVAPFFLVGSVL